MREWFVCFLLFLYVKAAQELRLLFANKGRGSSEAREYWLGREKRLGQEMLCDVEVNGGGTIAKGENCNNNNNNNDTNNRQ